MWYLGACRNIDMSLSRNIGVNGLLSVGDLAAEETIELEERLIVVTVINVQVTCHLCKAWQ